MDIELFSMERYQSLYWHQVEYDLSESGVLPMSIRELLGPDADAEDFLADQARLSRCPRARSRRGPTSPSGTPRRTPEHVTVVNGGSEANFLTLLALLDPGDRLAFMVPNYLQGPASDAPSDAEPTRSASSCRTVAGRSTSTSSNASSASRPR